MRVYILIFLVSCIISTNCFSQNTESEGVTDVTKITVINPGFSYEKKIGKIQSLYARAYMITSFGIGFSSSLGTTTYLHFDPAATLQYRYYYNLARRLEKGKRTDLNSLNYVTSVLVAAFSKEKISSGDLSETKARALKTFGLAWGFQRNYPNRFSLDFNIGGGYVFGEGTTINDYGEFVSKHSGRFTTVGQLSLGFWLNKKKE